MLPRLFRQRALPLACIAVAFGCAGAHAADKPMFSASGYGTVGAVHSNSRHADFVSDILKADGAGATHPTSFSIDSRLAVQVDVAKGKWSGVLQLVSEQGRDHSFRPIIEWGNLKYQATPELALRLGRIALPMFLAADYRKVGFAHPWVRPPVELYGTIPITNSDGIDATYRVNHGDVTHLTQVFVGRTEVNFDNVTRANAHRLVGFAHTVEHGALTARLSALRAHVTLDLARELFDGYRQFGPAGAAIADALDANDTPSDAISVGISYDPGNWFAMGEIGRLNTRSFIGDKTAFYLSAGYRTGRLTTYATFARSRPNMQTTGLGLSLQGMPPQQAAVAAMMNAKLDDLMRYLANQETAGVGVRWDVADNVAVKAQYDRVRTRGGSYGTLIQVKRGFESGRPVGVASVSVDFVF